MAYKVFTNGSVLNASEINDNLMNQSVMVFSNSTARAAALTAPVEGMLTWLQDTNRYEYRDGSGAWVALGASGILQVVSTSKTDTFTTSSLTYTTVTGLTATITPSSASSKILVMAQIAVGGNDANTGAGFFKVTRGGTDFYRGDSAGSRTQAVFGGYTSSGLQHMLWSESIIAQDSPASTSALTYQVETMVHNAFGTSRVNRSGDDSNNNTVARGASSITLMEVAA